MSMTNRTTTTDREYERLDRPERHHGWTETRLFARTSEFWAMIVGVAAIVGIYNASDDPSFDLWRACLLGTVLAVAYIVSRGIAKAGTRADDGQYDDADRRR
jgi:hypothetical protein